MERRIRIIVSALFMAAFLATAPLVLLLTSGYRYNWKRHRIEKTGLLQVETTPTGATVLLDGAVQRKTTPATFPHLLPEDYDVRVQRAGYVPWEKTLEVRSGQTTFATGVTLLKDALPTSLLERPIESAVWSEDAKRVTFIADDGGWKELAARGADGKVGLLARFARDTYTSVSLAWSSDGSALLFAGDRADGTTDLVRYRPTDARPALPIDQEFPRGRLRARWSDDGREILVTSADGIFAANAETGATTPFDLDPAALDAATRGRTGYAVLRDGDGATIAKRTGGTFGPLAALPTADYRFLDDHDADQLLLVDARKGSLAVVDAASGRVTTMDGVGAAWDPLAGGRRLLVWSDFEVDVVDVSDGSRTIVTRIGAPLGSCGWGPDSRWTICSTPTAIDAVELDDRDRRNTVDLARFTAIGGFSVDRATNTLELFGDIGNRKGLFERGL